MLDSPRYICCEKYSAFLAIHIGDKSTKCSFWASISAQCHFNWVWLLSLTKAWIPWRNLVLWLKFITLPFFKGLHKLQCRAGCESMLSSRKFTIFKNLISIFYLSLSLGVMGFLLELQRCPFLRHKKTLCQDFLLFLMYFKGWLSFKSVKIQLYLDRLY